MQIIEIADLQESEHQPFTWFEGEQFGSGVSLVIISSDEPGVGPYLHQHPYSETFVIRTGRGLFTVGDEQITGAGGQIIVVPALTPHKFAVIGPDRLEMIDIHASATFITEWLEGPRAVG
ncbi:MAG: cupin domain-containing protein [Chloroflexota bacterium]|nr:cupin domain-containing protein [Chloroflexota bacterium]MDQ5864953.1 cupin domain-containing protein [Chloroflexota bacterium]